MGKRNATAVATLSVADSGKITDVVIEGSATELVTTTELVVADSVMGKELDDMVAPEPDEECDDLSVVCGAGTNGHPYTSPVSGNSYSVIRPGEYKEYCPVINGARLKRVDGTDWHDFVRKKAVEQLERVERAANPAYKYSVYPKKGAETTTTREETTATRAETTTTMAATRAATRTATRAATRATGPVTNTARAGRKAPSQEAMAAIIVELNHLETKSDFTIADADRMKSLKARRDDMLALMDDAERAAEAKAAEAARAGARAVECEEIDLEMGGAILTPEEEMARAQAEIDMAASMAASIPEAE